MNAHGVAVERDLGRPIMSSLHGGWSVGGFLAAGLSAVAGRGRADPRLLALASASRCGCPRSSSPPGSAGLDPLRGQRLRAPRRGVILIGVLCFLAMVTEGAIGDWSGIYLREDLGASAAAAATGFAGFSLGMAIARLGGDWLNERLGAGPAAARRDGAGRARARRAAADRRAGAGRGRLHARRPRDRQRRADPLQRRRPPRADRPVAGRRSSPSATRASSSARR